MDFTCIDFETANSRRSSPCSLGITVVRDNKIVEEKYWLIKPNPCVFDPMNIMIHGIREGDVLDQKEFNELWDEIRPYLENQLVVAHNASFDFSVLRNTLDNYKIEYPNLDYCCTLVASKIFYNYLPNHKLNTVNKHLGHKFKHHHASADATAAANILINIAEELQSNNIEEIADIIGFKIGRLMNNSYLPCRKLQLGMTSSRCSTFSGLNDEPIFKSETDFFKDKTVVFTGPLGIMERREAEYLISKLGGIIRNSVTKKTDILITNARDPESLNPLQMSTKLRTAMDYKSRGQDIILLNAEEFENILLGYPAE